jgi:hypothetical protein
MVKTTNRQISNMEQATPAMNQVSGSIGHFWSLYEIYLEYL